MEMSTACLEGRNKRAYAFLLAMRVRPCTCHPEISNRWGWARRSVEGTDKYDGSLERVFIFELTELSTKVVRRENAY